MRSGVLVNFYSTVTAFQEGYTNRNPGLIIASEAGSGEYIDRMHAYVLWNTGEITREHLTYLKVIND